VHVVFRFEVLRQGADVDPLRIAQSPGAGRCLAKRDPAAHRQCGKCPVNGVAGGIARGKVEVDLPPAQSSMATGQFGRRRWQRRRVATQEGR
jgi:hypothetical protein